MKDCIIIGGGPAGLMCAHQFSKHGVDFILLEKSEKVGKKLLISGNKRCNVTNNKDVEEFVDDLTIKNKKFLYSSLYTFGPSQVLSFFDELGVSMKLENNLKYFPESNKAQSILDALLTTIDEKNIFISESVHKIVKEQDYYVVYSSEETYKTKNVVIATGSNSFPATGSSGDGLLFAKDLNIKYDAFTPAETHVYSSQSIKDFEELKGLSYPKVTVTINNTRINFKHDILFTHLGLSGPVIYHLSEFIYEELQKGNNEVSINFVNKTKETVINEMRFGDQKIKLYLNQYFTKKHVKTLMSQMKLTKLHLSELNRDEIEMVATYLTGYIVKIDKVEAREKSYVNKGGVLTSELSPYNLESKNNKGVYFIGETTNLHGPIGGYNITIALSTALTASLDIIEKTVGL
jgi:hypothetical protein